MQPIESVRQGLLESQLGPIKHNKTSIKSIHLGVINQHKFISDNLHVTMLLTAAWAVTCVQATILAPSNGLSVQLRLRNSISPGISKQKQQITKLWHEGKEHNALKKQSKHTGAEPQSIPQSLRQLNFCLPCSAISISLRPKSASLMLLTQKSLPPLLFFCSGIQEIWYYMFVY